MEKNPLTKLNKLKRYAGYISDKVRQTICGFSPLEDEIEKIDCLNREDIYTRRDMWEKLDAIAECANVVELRKYDGEIRIHNANFCHNPAVCAVCADRVSKRRRSIFSEPIRRAVRRFGVAPGSGDWKSEYPAGYTGVYMATATIRDDGNLKGRIDTLLDSIRRMRKRGQKRAAGRSGGEWSKIRAGLSNVEIKIGSGSNSWHVHAHFLIFTDSPIDIRVKDSPYFITRKNCNSLQNEKIQVSKFTHEWWTATGGEGINFDVESVQFRPVVHGRDCTTFEESVMMQAQEVVKYSTMLSEKKGLNILDAARYVELIQRRGNRRLFNTIGLFRCDSRNPEALITISERQLRRLEYVDEMDQKEYEIYSSVWQSGGTYREPQKVEGALFKSSDDIHTRYINIRRRAFQVQAAIYQGEYRKTRNGFLKSRENHNDKNAFELLLDECRDIFRNRVAELWKRYGDAEYIPEFLTGFDSGGMSEFRKKHLDFRPLLSIIAERSTAAIRAGLVAAA